MPAPAMAFRWGRHHTCCLLALDGTHSWNNNNKHHPVLTLVAKKNQKQNNKASKQARSSLIQQQKKNDVGATDEHSCTSLICSHSKQCQTLADCLLNHSWKRRFVWTNTAHSRQQARRRSIASFLPPTISMWWAKQKSQSCHWSPSWLGDDNKAFKAFCLIQNKKCCFVTHFSV